jgi:hypothetical protein
MRHSIRRHSILRHRILRVSRVRALGSLLRKPRHPDRSEAKWRNLLFARTTANPRAHSDPAHRGGWDTVRFKMELYPSR